MVRGVVVVIGAERLGALLIAAGALFGRSRPLASRAIASSGVWLLVTRCGVLVERARVQLGDLAQALLDFGAVGYSAVSLSCAGA